MLNMGCYINADDITQDLISGVFSFTAYQLKVEKKHFTAFASESGLLNTSFTLQHFLDSFTLSKNKLKLTKGAAAEYLAQVLARYLREQLLAQKISFSFETVFSHPSNIEIMRRAAAAGYNVYLYFVSTESPAINKYRVQLRVKKGGHDVPEDKIESRYFRSLDLLHEAALVCKRVFFFDNSGATYQLVAELLQGKIIRSLAAGQLPQWYKKYYLAKQKTT